MTKYFFNTIIGENTTAKVCFLFSPGRPAKIYGDNPHPEEPAEIEIYSVTANGGVFLEDLSEECLERIKNEAGEYLNNLEGR